MHLGNEHPWSFASILPFPCQRQREGVAAVLWRDHRQLRAEIGTGPRLSIGAHYRQDWESSELRSWYTKKWQRWKPPAPTSSIPPVRTKSNNMSTTAGYRGVWNRYHTTPLTARKTFVGVILLEVIGQGRLTRIKTPDDGRAGHIRRT